MLCPSGHSEAVLRRKSDNSGIREDRIRRIPLGKDITMATSHQVSPLKKLKATRADGKLSPMFLVHPFFLIHLAVLGVFFVTFRWKYVALMLVAYVVRMFFVTAGYHRYFSHRSFKLNRFWQFMLAFAAESSGQKGVLWWAAHHRTHHQFSDREQDIHSPIWKGLWWSHVGWILSCDYDDYDPRLIQDFGKYPELRWLAKFHSIPIVPLGALTWLVGGWSAFFWVFVGSTILLYHGTFSINSLSHLWGTRRFETPDDSRNNFVLALITLGEGWHNNHHKFMYACRQGIRWWEVDFTYYVLRMLSWVGITRDIREFRLPSETARDVAA
jgi:stearoyl-CoA desaturase (delta-9 desaturase)